MSSSRNVLWKSDRNPKYEDGKRQQREEWGKREEMNWKHCLRVEGKCFHQQWNVEKKEMPQGEKMIERDNEELLLAFQWQSADSWEWKPRFRRIEGWMSYTGREVHLRNLSMNWKKKKKIAKTSGLKEQWCQISLLGAGSLYGWVNCNTNWEELPL